MARKQVILVGEKGSASAAYKVERFARLIGMTKVTIKWDENLARYEVRGSGEISFHTTPNDCIIELNNRARRNRK